MKSHSKLVYCKYLGNKASPANWKKPALSAPVLFISTLGMVAKHFVFCRPPVKMNRTKKLKKKSTPRTANNFGAQPAKMESTSRQRRRSGVQLPLNQRARRQAFPSACPFCSANIGKKTTRTICRYSRVFWKATRFPIATSLLKRVCLKACAPIHPRNPPCSINEFTTIWASTPEKLPSGSDEEFLSRAPAESTWAVLGPLDPALPSQTSMGPMAKLALLGPHLKPSGSQNLIRFFVPGPSKMNSCNPRKIREPSKMNCCNPRKIM